MWCEAETPCSCEIFYLKTYAAKSKRLSCEEEREEKIIVP